MRIDPLEGAAPSACFDKLSTDGVDPFALSLPKGADGAAPSRWCADNGSTSN